MLLVYVSERGAYPGGAADVRPEAEDEITVF